MLQFYDLTLDDLTQFLLGRGKERFRAEQIFKWVYHRRCEDLESMTDLAKSFRTEVASLLRFDRPQLVHHRHSTDGTRKLLFAVGQERPESLTVESVLIPATDRLTLCVSTEVGCNMACRFCYTGKQKLQRRLTVSEIVGQFVGAQQVLGPNERITNIVFMGMGEPLDNPEALLRAIEILHSPWGCNISRRRITVSTSGLVPQIPLVTRAGVRLAVSLNGSNDAVRSFVMPINKKYPLRDLLQACRDHCREARDKVTFEYVLLKDVTDSLEQARELYRLTRDIPCKINIIPFNEHPNSGFTRPDDQRIREFQDELIRLGAHVLRRKTMGRDILAACGQLTTKTPRPEFAMNQRSSVL